MCWNQGHPVLILTALDDPPPLPVLPVVFKQTPKLLPANHEKWVCPVNQINNEVGRGVLESFMLDSRQPHFLFCLASLSRFALISDADAGLNASMSLGAHFIQRFAGDLQRD
jgi:hypothetical protein